MSFSLEDCPLTKEDFILILSYLIAIGMKEGNIAPLKALTDKLIGWLKQ